jgi:uncharacterized repeat protein (TIGR03803 family)
MSIARLLAIAAVTVAAPLAAKAGTFTTLYTFTGSTDGGGPRGQLVYRNGSLYGVTSAGFNNDEYGNVFAVDIKTGKLTEIYEFTGGTNGSNPNDLISHGGMFYGTTFQGGNGCNGGCGTVFSLNSKTGKQTVLYSFPDPGNGNQPFPGGLIYEGGMLYGVAPYSGNNGNGTIFAINPITGTETTLFNFNGTDGQTPNPSLVFTNGLLYGTTLQGGANSCTLHNNPVGCGVVFGIDPSTDAESIIYSFTEGADGFLPYSTLIYGKGLLYGATLVGGDMSCHHDGCGTLYSVSIQTGAEEVLTTNRVPGSKYNPAGIADHGASIYETFPGSGRSLGELVKFDVKSRHKTVLHKFNGADGSLPVAPLTYHSGVYYGTTLEGGQSNYGTVFKYVP